VDTTRDIGEMEERRVRVRRGSSATISGKSWFVRWSVIGVGLELGLGLETDKEPAMAYPRVW
jgi:hypothetical protein